MNGWKKARNYAELARVSNLPTCVSNVLTGCSLSAQAEFPWLTAAGVSLAVCSFYVGGMALNDACDVEADRVERPERPIPSGRVTLRAAYTFAMVSFAAGMVLLVPFGKSALVLGGVLTAVIIGYDYFHKRFAWVSLLMGATRGLVYLVAAAAAAWPLEGLRVYGLAVALAAYTLAITVVAQSENRAQLGARRRIAPLMPLVVLGPGFAWTPERIGIAVAAGLAVLGWQARAIRSVYASPPQTKKAILTWLSGMCLVDGYFIALLNRPAAVLAALGCFFATVALHRRILGT